MAELTSIAFIPDGNRRYAKKMGLPLFDGYFQGAQKAWDVLQWTLEYPHIRTGTFWALALDNLRNRSQLELKVLFKIFEHELGKVKEGSLFDTHQIRLKFLGRTGLFPRNLQEKMKQAEAFTENFRNKTMNVALCYSGQAEVVDAAKRLAVDVSTKKIAPDAVDERAFKDYLYGDFPDPDLIIRTGGQHRLSGFLSYQSAYSELYFMDKYWPELTQQDLGQAIDFYNSAQRNFGK